MRIFWYGHAAFRLTSEGGVRIIIDPYQSGAFDGALMYGKVADEADIVLKSHDHDDHNYTEDIKGSFTGIDHEGDYTIRDFHIRAIPTFHDQAEGAERGRNLVFRIEGDGLVVVHAGDLGHIPDPDFIRELGKVDVLLLPVGGLYTIDSHEATMIMEALRPSITIPMHYKTEKCAFPIAPVEEFTRGKKNVRLPGSSEVDITKQTLPEEMTIIVLNHGR